MRNSVFSESQFVAFLIEADTGMKVREVCRKQGISDATFYEWKSWYCGMNVSDLRWIRELEAENARLKRMYADLTLESRTMKNLIAKEL